jgi:sialate O-acetylesterase
MLMTIAPYTVRGVLWYQGESDEEMGHADIHGSMLKGLISDWRKAMKDTELPFLIVQLPGWERWLVSVNNDYMTVREFQQQVADTVDNVWLCSISDVGEQFDIHPKNKLPVGERLALLARGHVYGEAILCDAPRGISAAREGQEIKITFTGAEGGLEIRGDELAAMEVICDGKPVEFTASVDGEELVLTLAEECSCPADVRFAKKAWYLVNLYNKAGIPAVPFMLNTEA